MAIQPGSTQPPGSGGFTNPMTDLGDMIYGGAGGTPLALSAGDDGQVLRMDSAGIPEWYDLFNSDGSINLGTAPDGWKIGPESITSLNPFLTEPVFQSDGNSTLVQGNNVSIVANGTNTKLDVLDNGFIFFDTNNNQLLDMLYDGATGKNTIAFNSVESFTVNGIGFIENQNAAAQVSANAWIDGEWICSNTDYLTILSAGQIDNLDSSGGSADWAIQSESSPTLGAYWVTINGTMFFGNKSGAQFAPVIPTDLVRLNELQVPYGAWSGQSAGMTVLSIVAVSSGLGTDASLYEVAISVDWRDHGGQMEVQLAFTDANGNSVTKVMYPMGNAIGIGGGNVISGLSTYILFPTVSIFAKAGTNITVSTVLVSGTLDYDVTAFIRYSYLIP